ncbi:MAG: hypothetical protein C4524_08795 [Candidatus Zixiibacteriota bacterium]|nr:MAG: hypothetical protein C4524_08795 [candidate division Zixibacteria bacterium]
MATRPLWLPDAFLIRIGSDKLEAATGYRLEAGDGRVRFHRLDLSDITLHDTTGQVVITASRLEIRWRVLPLLQRRLVIRSLELDRPHIALAPFLHPPPEQFPQPVPEDTASISQPAPAPSSPDAFPLEIYLQRLDITRAALRLEQDGLAARIGGLDLSLREARIRSSRDYRAGLTMSLDDSLYLRWQRDSVTVDLACAAALELSASTEHDSGRARLALRLVPRLQAGMAAAARQDVPLPDVTLTAAAVFTPAGAILADSLALEFDGRPALRASARVDLPGRRLDLEVTEGRVNLAEAWEILGRWQSVRGDQHGRERPRLAGDLALRECSLGLSLDPARPDLAVVLRGGLEGLSYRDPEAGLSLEGLGLNAFFRGRLFPLAWAHVDAGLDLSLRSLAVDHPGGAVMAVDQFDLGVAVKVDSGLAHPEAQLVWEGNGPWGAANRGSFAAVAERLDTTRWTASPGLLVEGSAALAGLNLAAAPAPGFEGLLDAALDLTARGLEDVTARVTLEGRETALKLSQRDLPLTGLALAADLAGSLSEDFASLRWREIHATLPPYASLDGAGRFGRSGWALDTLRATLTTEPLLEFIRPLLPPDLAAAALSGSLTLAGRAKSAPAWGTGLAWHGDLALTGAGLAFDLPAWGVSGDSVELGATASGDGNLLAVEAETWAGNLYLPRMRQAPFRHAGAGLRGQLRDGTRLQDAFAWAESREMHLDAQGYGELEPADTGLAGRWEVQIQLRADDPVQPLDSLWVEGRADAAIILDLPVATLQGHLRSDSLALQWGQDVRLEGLRLRLPLDRGRLPADGANRALSDPLPPELTDPALYSAWQHRLSASPEAGSIRLERVESGEYRMQHLDGRLHLLNNRLILPRFSLEAYGGSLLGSAWMEFSALHPDSVRWGVRGSAERINTSLLPGIASSVTGAEGEIGAFGHFQGRGFDPAGMALEGGLDITRIGRQVADNLLRFLDPEETDPSIQTYRGYLRRGWGVRVFSFTVKDDFVYAALTPAKPPFSQLDMFLVSRLVGLGRSVTFGRVPLRFFLQRPGASLPPAQ